MIGALGMLQADQLPWGGQLAMFGPTIVILVLLLGFMLKAMPTWKELRMRELAVREEEAKSRAEHAMALKAVGGSLEALGGSLNRSSQLLENVALEQRRATDAVRLLQRVNSQTTERLEGIVHDVITRVGAIEERHAEKDGGTSAYGA